MTAEQLRILETKLWTAADQLRANSKLTATEYSFPVLGLIFLRHAHSRFKAAEAGILATLPVHPQRGRRAVTKDDFLKAKALYLSEHARWDYIADLPESADIGEAIDEAMRTIERDYEVLEGVLPKNYSIFEKGLLHRLVRVFNTEVLDQNPLRIDYYERYRAIIDEYNRGKEAVTIEEIFRKLRELVDDLTEEEARSTREGLNENELTIFDLLRQDKNLSDKDRHEIKEIARGLLQQLEDATLKVNRWSEKPQTVAAVRGAIRDFLFTKLPYPLYNEADTGTKTDAVYEFLRMGYRGGLNLKISLLRAT